MLSNCSGEGRKCKRWERLCIWGEGLGEEIKNMEGGIGVSYQMSFKGYKAEYGSKPVEKKKLLFRTRWARN